jgi:hypothetical protein
MGNGPRQQADLEERKRLLAERLQRLANAMGERAVRRAHGMARREDAQDDAAENLAWEQTLRRLEEITEEQERLLRERGVPPK